MAPYLISEEFKEISEITETIEYWVSNEQTIERSLISEIDY